MTQTPASRRFGFLDEPRVKTLFAVLDHGGESARVVGGAVRNALIGLPVVDVDFCTTSPPEMVMARAAAARLKCVPTGIEHGTVMVVVEGAGFEVTTLREDIETDGRRAKVRFGRDYEQDALRRDFTMNALAVEASGRLHDYCDGLADLRARRLRFIGKPELRIAEDYLRILRFFRFHAAFGDGEPDAAGLAACIAGRAGLAGLSRERVRTEILKLLAARRGPDAAASMAEAGLLGPLLGGAPYVARLRALATIEAEHKLAADALLRLAGVAVMTAGDAARVAAGLRLSNAEATRLETMAEGLAPMRAGAAPPAYGVLREALFQHGRQASRDALLLTQAGAGVAPGDAGFASAWRFLRDTPEPRLPFGGADVVARGVASGKAVGDILKRLQASWIRAGFPTDPATLARLLDGAMHE